MATVVQPREWKGELLPRGLGGSGFLTLKRPRWYSWAVLEEYRSIRVFMNGKELELVSPIGCDEWD